MVKKKYAFLKTSVCYALCFPSFLGRISDLVSLEEEEPLEPAELEHACEGMEVENGENLKVVETSVAKVQEKTTVSAFVPVISAQDIERATGAVECSDMKCESVAENVESEEKPLAAASLASPEITVHLIGEEGPPASGTSENTNIGDCPDQAGGTAEDSGVDKKGADVKEINNDDKLNELLHRLGLEEEEEDYDDNVELGKLTRALSETHRRRQRRLNKAGLGGGGTLLGGSSSSGAVARPAAGVGGGGRGVGGRGDTLIPRSLQHLHLEANCSRGGRGTVRRNVFSLMQFFRPRLTVGKGVKIDEGREIE